jgi:hypothetical protein
MKNENTGPLTPNEWISSKYNGSFLQEIPVVVPVGTGLSVWFITRTLLNSEKNQVANEQEIAVLENQRATNGDTLSYNVINQYSRGELSGQQILKQSDTTNVVTCTQQIDTIKNQPANNEIGAAAVGTLAFWAGLVMGGSKLFGDGTVHEFYQNVDLFFAEKLGIAPKGTLATKKRRDTIHPGD